MHRLSDKWILWAHLPQDSNWEIESYIQIATISYVEEMLSLIHSLPDKLITDCMFFLMKEHIKPIWEDVNNKNGGCFSYKITQHIAECWRDMCFSLSGKTLSPNKLFSNTITGISISPKKKFCIVKVWMSTCNFQDPTQIKMLKPLGCIFKKH